MILVDEGESREDGYSPLELRSALAPPPGEAACVLSDSLETWPSSYP